MTNELTYEQETVRSVFGAYINDLKTYSSKPDRPMFRRLEEVRDKAIKALEQPRWIPVSERLPKPDEFVLVTYKRWGHGDNDLFKDLPEYVYSTYFAYYDIHRGFGNENEDVIAWMPLPEPYKEDKE